MEEFGEPGERIWNCLRSAWISSPYIFREKVFAFHIKLPYRVDPNAEMVKEIIIQNGGSEMQIIFMVSTISLARIQITCRFNEFL